VSAAPVRAAIALGGNIGDVAGAFAAALLHLARTPGVAVFGVSSVWRTPAWGRTDQPDFLNAAVLVETSLPAEHLLALCHAIERAAGRERREIWGPRTLDLDLVFYGDMRCDRPDLTLPHPRAAERAFVLVPLAEIAPDVRLGGTPVRELAARADASGIEKDAAASARIAAALA
jgi:2-amino-4-hydroxy-6-hydroxymethyldihydropteridine diphosphokinase